MGCHKFFFSSNCTFLRLWVCNTHLKLYQTGKSFILMSGQLKTNAFYKKSHIKWLYFLKYQHVLWYIFIIPTLERSWEMSSSTLTQVPLACREVKRLMSHSYEGHCHHHIPEVGSSHGTPCPSYQTAEWLLTPHHSSRP